MKQPPVALSHGALLCLFHDKCIERSRNMPHMSCWQPSRPALVLSLPTPSCLQLSYPSATTKVIALPEMLNIMAYSEDESYSEIIEKLPIFVAMAPFMRRAHPLPLLIGNRKVGVQVRCGMMSMRWPLGRGVW